MKQKLMFCFIGIIAVLSAALFSACGGGGGGGGFFGIGGETGIGKTVFFAGTSGPTGLELWKTDGTAAGTVLVKDIMRGICRFCSVWVHRSGRQDLFSAEDMPDSSELWKSDGTAAGTVLVKDIYPGAARLVVRQT